MTFLPIVQRELSVAARRRATWRLRLILALSAFGIWFALLATTNWPAFFQRGKLLFIAIGTLALAFSLLAGMFLTADCLSEEKREGTLGLLFLTPLKGYDVVCGKLIATSLHAFYGLLGILPLLALPLLIGGVSVGEFWRLTLALVTTLFFSLALGMFVSAVSHDSRESLTRTLLLLLILAGILPAIAWVQATLGPSTLPSFFCWTSPIYLFSHSFDSFFNSRLGYSQFFGAWLTLLGIGSSALIFASIHLPRALQRKGESSTTGSHRNQLARWRFRGRRRRFLLDENPLYWLGSRDRLPRVAAISGLAALAAVWACFYAGCFSQARGVADVAFGVVMFLGYGIHLLLKSCMAIESSRRLSDDKRSGALELLLVSPLRANEIIEGIALALRQTFFWPIALALAIDGALLWLVLVANPLDIEGEALGVFCEMYFGGSILLVFDASALKWTGMAMALKTAKHQRAVFATFARVMLLPWLGILLFVFMSMGGVASSPADASALIAVWIFGCICLDLVLIGGYRTALAARLRQIGESPASITSPTALPGKPLW